MRTSMPRLQQVSPPDARCGEVDYVPKRGDLIWLTFQPKAGHEQSGRRPALVVSPAAYNGKTGLALVCPVTSKVKGYPFEVPIGKEICVRGVVLADQLKSLDWQAREVEYIHCVPRSTMSEVIAKIRVLVEDDETSGASQPPD